MQAELRALRRGLTDRCIELSNDPWERLWLAIEATREYRLLAVRLY
jgi:hypothetical protein